MAAQLPEVELVGRTADERLLAHQDELPEHVGLPEPIPQWPGRRGVVAAGATMTGVTLVGGIGLAILGAISAITGGLGLGQVVELGAGLGLAGTHWGWVHVAELTANGVEGRRHGEVVDRRRQWLESLEPYTRYEVSTTVGDDGSISIVRVRRRALPSGEGRFTFQREVLSTEVHSADEPAAAVTERAESLRREAALETEREREAYRVAADAYETTLLDRHDEQSQLAAKRAASEALSERINTNLRDPPLVE
ncbi:MAG TPA: hypothetical protein VIX82_10165 [Solirubrobacteraceae bacterium]